LKFAELPTEICAALGDTLPIAFWICKVTGAAWWVTPPAEPANWIVKSAGVTLNVETETV